MVTNMREINEIIIHCSATPEGRDYTTDDINRWHRQRGFSCIGYHYVIYRDGSVNTGRREADIGAHCSGHNTNSIGICYIGGLDQNNKPKDTRTAAQRKALRVLVENLKKKYPRAEIYGHKDFANKACPCFDVKTEL